MAIEIGLTRRKNLAKKALQPTQPTQGMAGQTVKLKDGTDYTLKGASTGQSSIADSPILKNPSSGNALTNKNFIETPKPLPVEPQAQAPKLKPGMNADGTFDQNYIPGSEEEALSSGDAYTQNKRLANYYKSKGIEFNPENLSGSFEEDAKLFTENQKEQKGLLEMQVEKAKEEAKRRKLETNSAISAQFGANREGVMSESNQMIPGQVRGMMQDQYTTRLSELDQQKKTLLQQLKDNETNFVAGRADQIRSQLTEIAQQEAAVAKEQNAQMDQSRQFLDVLQKSGALANLSAEEVQFLESGMPGVPQGIVSAIADAQTRTLGTDQQKAQFEKQTTALNTFKGLAAQGIAIPNSALLDMSKQTGLPVEALMSFNESAQQIMADKTLDQAGKAQSIQKLGYELDQMSRGIFNDAQRNVDYLSQMYRNGASPEEIAAFKSAAKIQDTNDPMFQADLRLKQAEAFIKEKTARGEPITIDDQVKLLEAQQEYGDLGGYSDVGGGLSGEMVISTKPPQAGIKVSTENGEFKTTVPPNTEFQCGAYVNRVWGDRIFASEGTQKMAQIDKYGFRVGTLKGNKMTQTMSDEELAQKVKPGMAFVMPIANNIYDHVGLVAKVTPDGIITNEANANGRAKTSSVGPGKNNITSRFIPWNQLYGFMAPPNSKTVGGSSNASASPQKLNFAALQTLTAKELKEGFENGTYDLNQLTPKALDQVKKVLGESTIKKLQGDDTASNKADEVTFRQEQQLSDDFAKASGDFIKIRDSYNKIQEAAKNPTAAGDMSLIFSYMKILDPGSTVREGEFANAQNTTGVGGQILNSYNKAISGERLSDAQRKDFLNQAQKLYEAQKKSNDQLKAQFKQKAKSYNLNPDRVVFDYENLDSSSAQQNNFFGNLLNQFSGNQQVNQPSIGYTLPEDDEANDTHFNNI